MATALHLATTVVPLSANIQSKGSFKAGTVTGSKVAGVINDVAGGAIDLSAGTIVFEADIYALKGTDISGAPIEDSAMEALYASGNWTFTGDNLGNFSAVLNDQVGAQLLPGSYSAQFSMAA